MRTAYQVNETFEELASTLTANSEIDWTALAKISLDSRASEKDGQLGNGTNENMNSQVITEKVYFFRVVENCKLMYKELYKYYNRT